MIKMVDHPQKGRYIDHISELKDEIVTGKMNDGTTVHKVIGKVLKHGSVRIYDQQMQSAFSGFMKNGSVRS